MSVIVGKELDWGSYLFNEALNKLKENTNNFEGYEFFDIVVHKLSLTVYCLPEQLEQAKSIIHLLGANTSNRIINPPYCAFDIKCAESRIKASKLSLPAERLIFTTPTKQVMWVDSTNKWFFFVKDKKTTKKVKQLLQ